MTRASQSKPYVSSPQTVESSDDKSRARFKLQVKIVCQKAVRWESYIVHGSLLSPEIRRPTVGLLLLLLLTTATKVARACFGVGQGGGVLT